MEVRRLRMGEFPTWCHVPFALLLAYLAASVAWVNRFAWIVTGQGTSYWRYQAILFLSLGAVFLAQGARRHLRLPEKPGLGMGMIAGFLASTAALLSVSLSCPLGSSVAGAGASHAPQLALWYRVMAFVLTVLLSGGWLVGGFAAVVLGALRARRRKRIAALLALALAVCLVTAAWNAKANRPFAHVQVTHRPTGF